jgi:hypothetical protein
LLTICSSFRFLRRVKKVLRRFGRVCCLHVQGDNLVGMDTKWLGITSKSFTNYDQSGRVSWSRSPVGTHDEILISVIGKKKCVGYVEKQFGGNLAYQSHGRGRNKASNEQMRVCSKYSPFKGQQWCVGRSQEVRHSHLSICTFATTDHYLEILGASTCCPGLYGYSCTYTFQNNANIRFFPTTSASARTRFSHPEEGSSKFPRNVETYPYDKAEIQQKTIK